MEEHKLQGSHTRVYMQHASKGRLSNLSRTDLTIFLFRMRTPTTTITTTETTDTEIATGVLELVESRLSSDVPELAAGR